MVVIAETKQHNNTAMKNARKALICKGVYLFVTDDKTVAEVTATDNLTFTVDYLDTGYDRTLMFSGNNWRLATPVEVVQTKHTRTKCW